MSNEFKLVPVELLERLFSDEPDGYVTRMNARQELLALLAKPADQQGEPVYQTCDGVGGWVDVDRLRYTACRLEPEEYECRMLYRHAQPATVKVDERAEFDKWTVSQGRVVGYGGWHRDLQVWQARAKLNGIPS